MIIEVGDQVSVPTGTVFRIGERTNPETGQNGWVGMAELTPAQDW